jgi:cobalamin biosynthesis Mg chelatase CobN
MSALRAILLAGLVLFVLGLPSLAGVVEDAEETLQTVPSDNPSQRNLDGSADRWSPGDYGSARSSSASTAPSAPSGRSSGNSRAANSGSGGQSAAGGTYPEASETPAAAEQEAARRRQARDSADTKMSLIGVLILLALVAAAGIYSKRVGRDD